MKQSIHFLANTPLIPKMQIKLYIDKSDREEYETEIFMDINFKHYPLRDYKSMWSEMNCVVKDYAKIGKRNQHAIEKGNWENT